MHASVLFISFSILIFGKCSEGSENNAVNVLLGSFDIISGNLGFRMIFNVPSCQKCIFGLFRVWKVAPLGLLVAHNCCSGQ